MSAGTLECQRSEITIDQCSKSGVGNGTCEHAEAAGVICQGKECDALSFTPPDSKLGWLLT